MDQRELPPEAIAAIAAALRSDMERLGQIEREIVGLHNRIAAAQEYLRAIGVWEQMDRAERMQPDRGGARAAAKPVKSGRPVQSSDEGDATLADAAAELLVGLGRPVHYREIWAALEERGHRSSSTEPERVLLATLSKDNRFQNVGTGQWMLTDAARRTALIAESRTGGDTTRSKHPGP